MIAFTIYIVFQGVVIPAGSALQSLPATIIATLSMLTATLVLGVFFTLRGRRISRAVATDPMPCFACLYPLAQDQIVCPECGSHQNVDDLSSQWKEWIRKHRG